MFKDFIEKYTPDFDAAIAHFEKEAAKIRTGRATPALVEGVVVDVYGVPSPIKQIASISVPEARQLLVQPWDRSQLAEVEKAITKANLGAQISNDGLAIRLTFPPMTEENRRDLVKILHHKAEEARVGIRTVREDVWKAVVAAEKSGTMTEDEKFAGKDALQDIVDEYNQKIEDLRTRKEADIMTV